MMKIVVILIGIYLCIESALFRGLYNGHAFGAELCGKSVYPEQGNLFTTHAYTPYERLTYIYIYIIWFLLLFIVAKLIKKETLSQILSLPSIFLVFLGFIHIYNLKNGYVINEDKYYDLMRSTLQTSFIHILIALTLLIYQVVAIVKFSLHLERSKLKIE